MSDTRHFLTVEWCDNGRRGIFCDMNGNATSKDDEPFTREEMWNVLDTFEMILSPRSAELSEAEVNKYTYWTPLAEYSGQYGIALKEEDVPIREQGDPDADS